MTMLYEVLHALFQREQTGTTLYQCDIVDRERTLQGCHLKQLVQQYVGIGIALHVNNDTHPLTTRLIVHISNTLNLVLIGKVCNVCYEISLVNAIRNLCNHNLIVSLATLNLSLGTHHNTTTTSLVGIAHSLQTIDVCACGEIRTWDILHQSISIDIRIVDISTATINNLCQIMGRHVGSHTYSNTITTIYQQVRNLGRHHSRFNERVVEVRSHVNSFLIKVVHDMLTHLREAALCVSHGSRRVTIDRAEVTLTIYERVTHVPVLSHTNEGTID